MQLPGKYQQRRNQTIKLEITCYFLDKSALEKKFC